MVVTSIPCISTRMPAKHAIDCSSTSLTQALCACRSKVCTALVQSEETRMELAEEDDALETLGAGLLDDDTNQ